MNGTLISSKITEMRKAKYILSVKSKTKADKKVKVDQVDKSRY